MSLKAFPETFNMDKLKKGYFPHHFSKVCNKNYIGPIPSKKHYGFNQMNNERVNEKHVFDFQREIIEYCQPDVDILRRGMMKLREDFISLENIDHSVTKHRKQ